MIKTLKYCLNVKKRVEVLGYIEVFLFNKFNLINEKSKGAEFIQ